MNAHPLDRRTFLQSVTAAGAGLALGGRLLAQTAPAGAAATPAAAAVPAPAAAPVERLGIKLGFDNYAIRSMGWKAHALLDYGAKINIDSLLISDLDAYDSFDEAYLKDVKAKADGLGIQIHTGSWSICPTSRSFRNTWGTAEEHLALGIRVSRTLGSPVFRVILGNSGDRMTEGGIMARIKDTAKVCQALRSQAIDAGVKIAIENHAGDMQAWELVTLIEEAGKDYVGACVDPGNAAITLEDPLENLEIVGPYVATSSMRDSMVWETATGAGIAWMGMGEGNVDFKKYMARFKALCPGVPVHLELIGGTRTANYLQPEFWATYPNARAKDFARFVALAKTGTPQALPAGRGGGRGANPGGAAAGAAPGGAPGGRAGQNTPGTPVAGAAPAATAPGGAQARGGQGGARGGGGGGGAANPQQGEMQQRNLERSLAYCREVLGLGLKT
jgi:sugar phosphate isomerase/epimerase